MSEVTDPDVAALTEGLAQLATSEGLEKEEAVGGKEAEDDGYISEERSEKSEEKSLLEDEEKSEEKSLLEDEEILQPLSFAAQPAAPDIHYISRGPIDQESHFARGGHPYTRPGLGSQPADSQPPASVLLLRKANTKLPTRLEARVTWSNRHELCIEKHLLPDDTYFGEETVEKVQLFIQLNPNVKELKSFLADVKTELDTTGESKMRYIGPIVINLKTELAESQENRLLEKTTMEERTAAYNLVHQKELAQLTSGIGPHKDTVLSVLCAKRNPENPGQTYSQIHAVIQRLINHPDNSVKQTVFKLNNNQISAFEIAAITDNSLVACYLAEVMYNISEDTRSALRVLNCKDTQGNTILHLLARKGDSNLKTMHALLDMRLTDGTRVFTMISNSKKQFPMHIATQNVKNQPGTIRLLFQHMPRAFEVMDDDGMTALHYACQRSTDVELVRTVLSHKKDNINARTKDGLTALDLVSRRCRDATQTIGLFAIEPQQQAEVVTLVRNNGGRSGVLPEPGMQDPITNITNMGYSVLGGASPPQFASPEESPYSCHQSSVTSPRTPSGSVRSPCSPGQPSMNSVGSFHRSSPEGSPHGSPALAYQAGSLYQAGHMESQGGPGHISYEDHIVSQILTHFPEIGQILDNQ